MLGLGPVFEVLQGTFLAFDTDRCAAGRKSNGSMADGPDLSKDHPNISCRQLQLHDRPAEPLASTTKGQTYNGPRTSGAPTRPQAALGTPSLRHHHEPPESRPERHRLGRSASRGRRPRCHRSSAFSRSRQEGARARSKSRVPSVRLQQTALSRRAGSLPQPAADQLHEVELLPCLSRSEHLTTRRMPLHIVAARKYSERRRASSDRRARPAAVLNSSAEPSADRSCQPVGRPWGHAADPGPGRLDSWVSVRNGGFRKMGGWA